MNIEKAKKGLKILKQSGMKKINFAGGEPFLYPHYLEALCRYCKNELNLEKVSIVTNGTLVKEHFIQKNHNYIDMIGVSLDSFDEEINKKIGRGTGKNVIQAFKIAEMCKKYNIKFKLNTVVCKYNYNENMIENVQKLNPDRWKCFQVLMVKGENDSNETLRNAKEFLISDEQFKCFCDRHKNLKCFVNENNKIMANSYLILDEYMRFLYKNEKGIEVPSKCILDNDIQDVLKEVNWDEDAFKYRNGDYFLNDGMLNNNNNNVDIEDLAKKFR
jgi:radical S-adenosyl methionine domain-containing protein 2